MYEVGVRYVDVDRDKAYDYDVPDLAFLQSHYFPSAMATPWPCKTLTVISTS